MSAILLNHSLVFSQETIQLSMDEALRVALENNFDIQLAKYDIYIKRNDLAEARSIFDTLLTACAKKEWV